MTVRRGAAQGSAPRSCAAAKARSLDRALAAHPRSNGLRAQPAGGARDSATAPRRLWIALIFAGMSGRPACSSPSATTVASARYAEPARSRRALCAKLLAAFIFMAIAEVAAVVMMVLFFNLDFDSRLLRLAPISRLARSASRPYRLCSQPFPAAFARAICCCRCSPCRCSFRPDRGRQGERCGAHRRAGRRVRQWLKILIAFDVIFLATGYLLFEHVIAEDRR